MKFSLLRPVDIIAYIWRWGTNRTN